jgi:hypothetical protein
VKMISTNAVASDPTTSVTPGFAWGESVRVSGDGCLLLLEVLLITLVTSLLLFHDVADAA